MLASTDLAWLAHRNSLRPEATRVATLSWARAMWMPYRLFPYERRLGVRELEGLGLTVVDAKDDGVTVVGNVEPAAARCTYFDHFIPSRIRTRS